MLGLQGECRCGYLSKIAEYCRGGTHGVRARCFDACVVAPSPRMFRNLLRRINVALRRAF